MPYLADFILSVVAANLGRVPTHLTSYVPGKTPLSTWSIVISTTITYLVVVLGTHETMKGRPALKLTPLLRAHNLILSVGSLVLVVLIGEEVFSNWMKPEIGTYGLLCSSEAYTARLEFYLMLNYYFKYYELVDTIFSALRKKPLSFLHVYHHATALVLAFVQLNGRATMCWVAVFLNLSIHVLMYYYYYAAAGGSRIWWKQYLTTMQIAQFMVVLTAIAFVSYQYAAYNWFPGYLPHKGGCAVTVTAITVGAGIIFSYLVLFIDFFYETYPRKARSLDLVTWMRLAVQRRLKPRMVAPESRLFKVDKEWVGTSSCQLEGFDDPFAI